MDVYQGKMNTISSAFGSYDINIFFDIDSNTAATGSVTGMAGSVTGTGTLVPINWGMGLTGINGVVPTT